MLRDVDTRLCECPEHSYHYRTEKVSRLSENPLRQTEDHDLVRVHHFLQREFRLSGKNAAHRLAEEYLETVSNRLERLVARLFVLHFEIEHFFLDGEFFYVRYYVFSEYGRIKIRGHIDYLAHVVFE